MSTAPFRDSTVPCVRGNLPRVWEPADGAGHAALTAWIDGHRETVQQQLQASGAILLRGFGIDRPEAVEALASAFSPALGSDYLGTSPRNAVTARVFNASELPGHFPIPQHCEMSFVRSFPQRLFFSCLVAPAAGSGQTPICDFARVAETLDPAVAARFAHRRLRLIRNYAGLSRGTRDLWQLKRWDEMFGTTERNVVEARCREQGFEPEWIDGDGLRLVSFHDAFRTHASGRRVWFNHLQVFHRDAAAVELRRVLRHRFTPAGAFWWLAASALTAIRSRRPDLEQPMHMTWEDGSPIARSDIAHVADTIWDSLVVFDWQPGDFLAIDNTRVSHGRLPYRGARHVVVAWAGEER